MSLDEAPSSADLMTSEQELINARATMNSANEQSLVLAEMDPNIASQVMDEDALETASFNKLEKEILVRINKHKAYCRGLNPPSSHSAGGTASTSARSFQV